MALHLAWPIRLTTATLRTPLGVATTVLAIGLFLAAVRTFRAAGTPVPGNRPTTAIVRTGPYRYSRNPIYLAFSLLQIGIAFWVNATWLLVTVIPAVLLMSLVVIPREEAYLETHFPADYLPYKRAVRRWF
jgi:protein-S-isoprenylcysteine O-methyltransferase Ste14